MKKIILVISLIVVTLNGYSQSTKKNEKIKQLLELTGSAKIGVQMMNTMIPQFSKTYPNADKKFWDEFMSEVNTEDMIDIIIPIYEKYYTEEDIDQLIQFYNSPIGKKTVELMPFIMQESMQAGQAWGSELSLKVINKLKQKGYIQN